MCVDIQDVPVIVAQPLMCLCSSGLLWQLRPSDVEVELLAHTRNVISKDLEEETGLHTGWIQNGGLFIASNKQRLDEYKRLMSVKTETRQLRASLGKHRCTVGCQGKSWMCGEVFCNTGKLYSNVTVQYKSGYEPTTTENHKASCTKDFAPQITACSFCIVIKKKAFP